jgi:hypothetical protein
MQNQCVDCGTQDESKLNAEDTQRNKLCGPCAAKRTEQDMDKDGKAVLYLVQDDNKQQWTVSNWDGLLRFKAYNVKRHPHNIADRMLTFCFTDKQGKEWYGRQYGYSSDLAYCKRYK